MNNKNKFVLIAAIFHFTVTCAFAGTISWEGDSTGVLDIDVPLRSMQEFLQSPASDLYLLGTDTYIKRNDGLWDCQQPVIDFFGLSVQPVFVNRLDRQPSPSTSGVTVSIVDARTDIVKNPHSPTNIAVSNLMSKTKFVGKSLISVKPSSSSSSSSSGCQLECQLSLTLQIKLPKFMLLPPGFNTIGSAIVSRIGKSRTKQLLKEIEMAFSKEWLEETASNSSNSSHGSTTTLIVPAY